LANGIIRKTIGGVRILALAAITVTLSFSSGMHVDDLLNARERINKAVLSDMAFCKDEWGIDVVSYEGAFAVHRLYLPPLNRAEQFRTLLSTTSSQMQCMRRAVQSVSAVPASSKARASACRSRTSAKVPN
jgi:hypothetical protein